MESGRPPEPPVEWRDWKRKHLSDKIAASWHFMKGKEIDQIKILVNKPDVTKQCVALMINEGVKFLLSREFIYEAPATSSIQSSERKSS